MKELASNQIRASGKIGKVDVATSIAATCPFCGERVVFATAEFNHDPHRQSVSSHAPCANCGRLVYFWSVMGVKDGDGNGPVTAVHHYMFPVPSTGYPQPNLPANVPDALQRAFRSTIDSLNTRNFPATAVGARRTLEGIFKYLVDKEDAAKRSLLSSIRSRKATTLQRLWKHFLMPSGLVEISGHTSMTRMSPTPLWLIRWSSFSTT